MLKILWKLQCKGCGIKFEGNKYETVHSELRAHMRECKQRPKYWFYTTDFTVYTNEKDVTKDFKAVLDELRSADLIYYEEELTDVCADLAAMY